MRVIFFGEEIAGMYVQSVCDKRRVDARGLYMPSCSANERHKRAVSLCTLSSARDDAWVREMRMYCTVTQCQLTVLVCFVQVYPFFLELFGRLHERVGTHVPAAAHWRVDRTGVHLAL